jgi:hypothetical protein
MQHTHNPDLLRMGSSGLHSKSQGQTTRTPAPTAQPQGPRRNLMMSGNKLLLVAGLGALSWISTYSGMLELIEANMSDIDIVMKIAIGGSVAMLMLMIIWLLDQLFNEDNATSIRIVYALGYVFLTLISIGFSFGFYWKFLESRTEGSRSAEAAITQVQAAMTSAETRLTQLQTSFESLALISTQKAADEVATGRSCPNSRPGDGPRRRLRESDAASLTQASQFVKERAAVIRKDIAALGGDIEKIVKQDKSTFDAKTGTRNDFMRSINRKMELTTSGFNAFRTDPQLRQLRTDFAARAELTVFPDEQGKTFVCPDAQLQAGLRSGVKAIDSLPVMTTPEIATVEGAEATVEAFRRLLVTLTSLATFKLPVTPDDIRAEQQKAIQSLGAAAPPPVVNEQASGLGKRDWVPLLIAVFVDLCLLLVSIPPALSPKERNRRRRLGASGEVYRTISDLSAIYEEPRARRLLERFRHVAFDHFGHDYVAIPLIATNTVIDSDTHADESRGFFTFLRSQPERSEPVQLTDKDLEEAQELANSFVTHERDGSYRRISTRFVPVRAKLRSIGSKWQDVQSFRLYRFKQGAWSEFVYEMIEGSRSDESLSTIRQAKEILVTRDVDQRVAKLDREAELRWKEHEAELKTYERKITSLDLVTKRENLQLKLEEDKLQREIDRLENERVRQVAVEAEHFESYVPGEDRDPDGLLVRTRREKVQRPAESNPEIVALMQSVSQQALAAQEIARQQTAFMQEMAKTLALLAQNQANSQAQATSNSIRSVDHAASARGNLSVNGHPGALAPNASAPNAPANGVHQFPSQPQRDHSLDAARTAQREARPATEVPTVIPLHGERSSDAFDLTESEPHFSHDGDVHATRAAPDSYANGHGYSNGHGHSNAQGHPFGHGNAALSLQPAAQAVDATLPALGYGLSRLLGRDWGQRTAVIGDAMSQTAPARSHDTHQHVHAGIRFDDH